MSDKSHDGSQFWGAQCCPRSICACQEPAAPANQQIGCDVLIGRVGRTMFGIAAGWKVFFEEPLASHVKFSPHTVEARASPSPLVGAELVQVPGRSEFHDVWWNPMTTTGEAARNTHGTANRTPLGGVPRGTARWTWNSREQV
eukprot:354212-Chlamydomonas_euryale.AAC.4